MIGNLINNNQIIHLIEVEKLIKITPWDSEKLKTAHYPLVPRNVFKKESNEPQKLVHNFQQDGERCNVAENDYLIVEVFEQIILPKGIIGQFIPSSNLIEQGFGITAGRLEFPFGEKGETIRFGLKNLLNGPNELRASDQLAYIQFFDLRALKNIPPKMTARDMEIFAQRLARAQDDGVLYPQD